jgi:hypothetical protein
VEGGGGGGGKLVVVDWLRQNWRAVLRSNDATKTTQRNRAEQKKHVYLYSNSRARHFQPPAGQYPPYFGFPFWAWIAIY